MEKPSQNRGFLATRPMPRCPPSGPPFPLRYIADRELGLNKCQPGRNFMKDRLFRAENLFRKDLHAHYGCVNAVEFSNEGEWLVSGGDDRRVLLWNVEKAIQSTANPFCMKGKHSSNIFCLGFDNHNSKVFSSGNDEQVIVHDSQTGATLDVFLHEEAVYGLSIDPLNDSVFASACDDGRVLIWDIRDRNGSEPFCLASFSSAFHAVMYNPVDPRLLVTANSKMGVSLWDIRQPKKWLIRYGSSEHPVPSCMSVRFNSSGTQILALRRRFPPILFDIHSPTHRCQFDHTGYYNSCTMKSCCFAGGSDQYVLSGSDDFNLYLWKTPEEGSSDSVVNKASMILKGHRSIVNQVRFNTSNFLLASSGVEKIVKLWSPFQMPESSGGLTRDSPTMDKVRKVYTHDEYVNLVMRNGQAMTHDYSNESTLEDPRMMAFFDSLVQREIEGLTSDSSLSAGHSDSWLFNMAAESVTLSEIDSDSPESSSSSSSSSSTTTSPISAAASSDGEGREEERSASSSSTDRASLRSANASPPRKRLRRLARRQATAARSPANGDNLLGWQDAGGSQSPWAIVSDESTSSSTSSSAPDDDNVVDTERPANLERSEDGRLAGSSSGSSVQREAISWLVNQKRRRLMQTAESKVAGQMESGSVKRRKTDGGRPIRLRTFEGSSASETGQNVASCSLSLSSPTSKASSSSVASAHVQLASPSYSPVSSPSDLAESKVGGGATTTTRATYGKAVRVPSTAELPASSEQRKRRYSKRRNARIQDSDSDTAESGSETNPLIPAPRRRTTADGRLCEALVSLGRRRISQQPLQSTATLVECVAVGQSMMDATDTERAADRGAGTPDSGIASQSFELGGDRPTTTTSESSIEPSTPSVRFKHLRMRISTGNSGVGEETRPRRVYRKSAAAGDALD